MRLGVAVDAPQYAALGDVLHYLSAQALPPGSLLRVPLGRRDTLGLVWEQVSDEVPPTPA
jgi:primosomal protein N' (replication factor Y)